MSDEHALFAILFLIYFSDCFLWKGNFSFAFVSWTGRQWKLKDAGNLLRTSRGGLLLLNPLPPLGSVFCCHLPPLSISPHGICSLNGQAFTVNDGPVGDVLVASFDEIDSVRASGCDVIVNEKKFCTFRDPLQAEKTSELLKSLKNAAENSREAVITQYWKAQFDYEAAKMRYDQPGSALLHLKILCNILFVYLIVLAPSIYIYSQTVFMIVPLAVIMFVIGIAISAGYFLLHKRLHPGAGEDRMINVVKMILCPPTCIRACDLITEHLLGNFNPLVVGHLLFATDQFKDFAARTARNLTYFPIDLITDGRGRSIAGWQNDFLLKLVSGWLRDAAGITEKILVPPLPYEAGVRVYCPRCLSQFSVEAGKCPDCLGVELLAYDQNESLPITSE